MKEADLCSLFVGSSVSLSTRNMYILSSSLMWLPLQHTSLQGPRVGMIFYKVMYVVKRDGRTETVHFDKITVRLKKLSYGLSQEHRDPVLGLRQGIHGCHHQPARRARRRDRRPAHRLPARLCLPCGEDCCVQPAAKWK
ncbi:uncharacterized protein [Triticum aestivum]|uniref:uncharacterized protein isoform X3 n=1 Tax=Triticum aestivum TaxID=4565 RepID=UPI001D0274F3|nr:uncharacterized protein LOC123091913 isoform X3 [Triticum aestivum]